MHRLDLQDDELQLLRDALKAFLDDFGHEEADLLRRIKELLAKLDDLHLGRQRDDARLRRGRRRGRGGARSGRRLRDRRLDGRCTSCDREARSR